MQLIPAIDLRDGRCVRLLRGDFDRETRYEHDPLELAERYRGLGAAWLHVVDLDGARSGRPAPAHLDLAAAMRGAGTKIQLGGGIRNEASLKRALDVADRVVIGSLAVTEPDAVDQWMREFGADRLTLGFDVRLDGDGVPRLTTHGWTRDTELAIDSAIARFEEAGIRHVLCTDVARDGAQAGPNGALYARCVRAWPGLEFQASGGVRGLADLEALARLGVSAAICGKALLEGTLTEEEARSFLRGA